MTMMVPYTAMHVLSCHMGPSMAHAMQGMAMQLQAQPGMQQVLIQSPDGRGVRPPYPHPHHPLAPYGQQSPLASAPPTAGQHVMMVLPHSPQVKAAWGILGSQIWCQ